MPKTNQGGATYVGATGVVEHGAPLADGRLLSELDPERNLDGSLMGLDGKRYGLWAKDAKYVEGAPNFLPALVKLAPRYSHELVKYLN